MLPEGSGEQGKMEKTGCKIICGAPTTIAVKGLMMMMMMMMFRDGSEPCSARLRNRAERDSAPSASSVRHLLPGISR